MCRFCWDHKASRRTGDVLKRRSFQYEIPEYSVSFQYFHLSSHIQSFTLSQYRPPNQCKLSQQPPLFLPVSLPSNFMQMQLPKHSLLPPRMPNPSPPCHPTIYYTQFCVEEELVRVPLSVPILSQSVAISEASSNRSDRVTTLKSKPRYREEVPKELQI